MAGESLRFNSGKAKFSMVATDLMRGIARVMEYGAIKYARGNWRKGAPAVDQLDCLERHSGWIKEFLDTHANPGQKNIAFLYDAESWLPHIDHMLFNVLSLRMALVDEFGLPRDPVFNAAPSKEIDWNGFAQSVNEQHPGESFDLQAVKDRCKSGGGRKYSSAPTDASPLAGWNGTVVTVPCTDDQKKEDI